MQSDVGIGPQLHMERVDMDKLEDQSSLLYALKVNCRVVVALIMREMNSRFDQESAGFVWGLLEPLILVAFYIVIHTAMARSGAALGDDSLLFMITGVVAFRMSRGLVSACQTCIKQNLQLLTYPQVRPLDTFYARFLVETFRWLIVVFAFFGFLSIYIKGSVITHPDQFVEAILACLYLGGSMALFNAIVGILFPFWLKIWNIASMPLMLLSGLFYVPSEMPPPALAIMEWNPFLHCVEWMRTASYIDYISVLDKTYLLSFSTGVLLIALTLERTYRAKVLNS